MRLMLLAIQMLFVLSPLAADDALERYFADNLLSRLRGGELLTANIPADGTLSLLPAVGTAGSIATELRTHRPSLGIEISQIIPRLPQPMDTREGWLQLYNTLHAVSTLKGILYFSASRGTNRVLFTDAYVIDSADTKNRVSDPVFSEIPSENKILTFQEDKTFGKNVYEESFSYREDHLLARIDNLTTISFLLLPLIQPGNLVSEVILIPSGNDVLFYGLSYLTTSFPLADRVSRQESLGNRLVAMENWLKSRLGGETQ